MTEEQKQDMLNNIESLKDFLITKGSKELINLVKPILLSLFQDISQGNIKKLQPTNPNYNNYENLIKNLEFVKKQSYILAGDEKKLISFANAILEDKTESKPVDISNFSDYESKVAEEAIKKYQDAFKNSIEDIERKRKNEFDVFQNTLDEVNKKHQDALIEFENHKKALIEDNKLHEAKEYWSKKAKRHNSSALWSSMIFLVPVILLILLIFYITQKSPISTLLDSNQTMSTSISLINSSNSLLHYLPYLLIFSLLIWISRIFLKIMFSNLHLQEEALEKETQILTYLALIKEGAGLEENDRKLILEAIFRPSTNGLIKDESNVTLLDIANIFKGK